MVLFTPSAIQHKQTHAMIGTPERTNPVSARQIVSELLTQAVLLVVLELHSRIPASERTVLVLNWERALAGYWITALAQKVGRHRQTIRAVYLMCKQIVGLKGHRILDVYEMVHKTSTFIVKFKRKKY